MSLSAAAVLAFTAGSVDQVRYFILKDGVLSYYGDKKEAQDPKLQPKGSFHVLSITSIKTMPHKDKKFQNQAPAAAVYNQDGSGTPEPAAAV